MADKVAAGHVGGANGAREAVCIHTKKIYSSCRDKDCIEDLRFYPTATAQSVLSTAQGLRGGSAASKPRMSSRLTTSSITVALTRLAGCSSSSATAT
jgi:hypothetical protein